MSENALYLFYRVPFVLFRMLVEQTKGWYHYDETDNPTGIKETDAFGRPRIPVELLVLGVLRMLGRGYVLDGIKELSLISSTTMSTFFHRFNHETRRLLAPEWIKPPSSWQELAKTLRAYGFIGLPGCVGSFDVVHIWWDKCPTYLQNLFTGKEGFPTIAFQVHCLHNGWISWVCPGQYGSMNDKTVIRFDDYVSLIREGLYGKSIGYKLLSRVVTGGVSSVISTLFTNVYEICDGGYHNWLSTISAAKRNFSQEGIAFRKRLESVRKDIECVFGRLKGRFRCLKIPIQLHKKEQIEDMFFVCCILQNMLLKFDGSDNWGKEHDWLNREFSDFTDQGEHWGVPKYNNEPLTPEHDSSRGPDAENYLSGYDYFSVRKVQIVSGGVSLEEMKNSVSSQPINEQLRRLIELYAHVQPGFHTFRNALIEHFDIYRKYFQHGNAPWIRY